MKKDHDIFEEDNFRPATREGEDKLHFFWENCLPEEEDDVIASIRKKTVRKIQGEIGIQTIPSKKRKTNRLFITIASVAATIAILVSLPSVLRVLSHQEDIKQVVAQMEILPVEETDDVVLVMSDQERLQLASDAKIAYTPEGSVSVHSEGFQSVKDEQKKDKEEKNSFHKLYNQLIVPKGKRSQLLLSDGTKVWVNAGTKVIYPRVFGEKKREIYVDGEVYLEVTHDAERPFFVNTEGFEVKVLGTSFDVYAYKQMPDSRVVLVDGAVEIKDQHNKQMKMLPNDLVEFKQNSITEKRTVNASDYKAWIDGLMILNGDRLQQLAERLSLLYGTKIICDSSLDNEQVYGKLDLRDNLDEIIDYIHSMIPLSAREEKGVIYLTKK